MPSFSKSGARGSPNPSVRTASDYMETKSSFDRVIESQKNERESHNNSKADNSKANINISGSVNLTFGEGE